jgi:hypothetical protein
MARFHFNLRSMLAGSTAHPVISQRTLRALNLVDAEPDEWPGPGWFDSSGDLLRGLDVHEQDLHADAPLDDWLALCRREAAAGSAAAAQRDEQPGAGLVPAAPHGAFGDAVQFGDLGLAVAAEVTHLDEFSEFGIDGLELL